MMGFAYLNADVLSNGHGKYALAADKPRFAWFPFSIVVESVRHSTPATEPGYVIPASEGGKGSQRASAPSAVNRSTVDGKTILMALRGCCVETSRLLTDSERIAEMKAEEKLRQSQDELRKLSMQLLAVQETERRRIAADLHDGIGQSMSLIKMSMESVAQLLNAGSHQEAAEALQLMIHKVKDTMAELRTITTDLRPSMLDDLGLLPTLSWFFREFETAWRDRKIEKDFCIAESDMSIQLKTTIFRIIQEAMNNIIKHANAKRIRVALKNTNGMLQLSIEDNGQGFEPAGMFIHRESGRGLGLLTMRERARSSDGIFEMKSTPGKGTWIRVSWRHNDAAMEHRPKVFQNLRTLQPAIAI